MVDLSLPEPIGMHRQVWNRTNSTGQQVVQGRRDPKHQVTRATGPLIDRSFDDLPETTKLAALLNYESIYATPQKLFTNISERVLKTDAPT
jgi:hypothetical protein